MRSDVERMVQSEIEGMSVCVCAFTHACVYVCMCVCVPDLHEALPGRGPVCAHDLECL